MSRRNAPVNNSQQKSISQKEESISVTHDKQVVFNLQAIEDSLKLLNDPQNRITVAQTVCQFSQLIEDESAPGTGT